MATKIEVCNRALQKLGARLITAIDENSKNAQELRACYDIILKSELRAHTWNCSIQRASLAADAPAPEWGRANAFQVPSDFLRLLPLYPEMNSNAIDNVVEGRKILSNDATPLYIRYVALIEPGTMDANFIEAFATRMASELCESITQSNTKKEGLRADYKEIISIAKRTNGIEVVPAQAADSTWTTVRD